MEGVELAPVMVEHARDRLGLKVHASPFANVELGKVAFDVITMWDYIEHSTDPAGDLRRAAELLRPGGMLAVSTGDAGSIVARVSGHRWHLLTPRHHNFFFTRSSLEQAFRAAGFEIRTAAYTSSFYSLHYLVHKLQTLWGASFLQRISRQLARTRFGGLAVPVNLHDIMVVVGRRTQVDVAET